jgi:putative ABC transport system ATP-binding protein
MDLFQELNATRGITVLLITHEIDIAEHATRIMSFRDGKILTDRPVTHRRLAAEEMLGQTLAVA